MNIEAIAQLRREFSASPMNIAELPMLPHELFENWLVDILKLPVDDPTACVLATVDEEGAPDTRVVLLKAFSKEHFIFYTNYRSQKALQIGANPKVALNFYWPSLFRQIRIRGQANQMSREESTHYFQTRPRESQIAAYASRQSEVTTRDALEKRFTVLTEYFSKESTIPCPKFWGGYCVTPVEYEFWQGRPHRLHDRVRYVLKDLSWEKQLLAP